MDAVEDYNNMDLPAVILETVTIWHLLTRAKKERSNLDPEVDTIALSSVDSVIGCDTAAQSLSLSTLAKNLPLSEVVANYQLLDSTGTVLPVAVSCYVTGRTASNALAEGRM